MRRPAVVLSALLLLTACQKNPTHAAGPGEGPVAPRVAATTPASVSPEAPRAALAPSLPLQRVADVELPGRSTRFDYQDIDPALGELVVSHMNDGEVLFLRLSDGALLARVSGIAVARGVAIASDLQRVFVTSSPHTLVVIDAKQHREAARVATGAGPDGVAWDPVDRLVGVSDQRDGALSLLADGGTGARRALKLGRETGNVVFDARRGWFWITVVGADGLDQLVGVLPSQASIERRWPLPGCESAHGLRVAPNGGSAFVACEGNHRLLQLDLEAGQVLATQATGEDPDVLSVDPGLGWLYVAAESGDLTIFDIRTPVLTLLGHDHPGPSSHSVAVDPASHRAFFPLKLGPNGKPVLRIMKPTGT
jgi:DNA-binding beta-propeller fold protein YncE